MSRIKILEVVAGVLVLAGIVFYFNSGGFCGGETLKLVVKGDSMAGIVENGEKVKVRKGYYDCHEIKRDDIVAYRYGKEELLVKRVVAVPGDAWRLEKKENGLFAIYINQVEQRTTKNLLYQFKEPQAKVLGLYKSPVPANTYIILGNQPGGTLDSSRFGFVDKGKLVGRVTW
jgi:signal peptidase I